MLATNDTASTRRASITNKTKSTSRFSESKTILQNATSMIASANKISRWNEGLRQDQCY